MSILSNHLTQRDLQAWRSYGRVIKVAGSKHWKKTGKLTEYEILPADGEPKTNLKPSVKQKPSIIKDFDNAFMARWQEELDQIPKTVEFECDNEL